MKGAIRTLSLMTSMFVPQFLRGYKKDKNTGETVPVKPRFVAGDQFYNQLRYKRVNGKWRVKR